MFPLGAILDIGSKIIDKLWPNPADAEAAKLKLLEMQQTGELAKMANDTELTKAYLGDVSSARERESAVATSDSAPYLNKIITPILALGVLIATFGLFAFVLFDKGAIDPTRKDILIYVLGVLSAIATQIVAYYFGSSKGSADKNTAIDKMLNHV
jgi:hypothetical protein